MRLSHGKVLIEGNFFYKTFFNITMVAAVSNSITPLAAVSSTTTTEEAWRVVEERAAVPPVVIVRGSRKEWCLLPSDYTNTASGSVAVPVECNNNIRASSSNNSSLLPIKKRRRVVVLDDDHASYQQQQPVDDIIPEQPAVTPPQPQPIISSNEQTVELESSSATLRCASKLLPHLLPSYQEIYNKNGHVGIYDPQQRAAILSRFHKKRMARKWRKRIRYDCRKDLADKRVRVKGRFVKGSIRCTSPASTTTSSCIPDITDVEAEFDPNESSPFRRVRRVTVP